MRLTCPNCDAQYEVPDEVVPTEGRDVQCSNCGNTWFQYHPDHAPQEDPTEAEADLAGMDMPPSEEPEAVPEETEQSVDLEPTIVEHAERQEELEEHSVEEPAPEEHAEEDVSDEESAEPAPALSQPREIDPAVANILQQEAEHEARLREDERNAGLESQPDLGLETGDEAGRRSREARDRMARIRGKYQDDPDTAHAADTGSRRGLLPDIEEINSTLRASEDGAEVDVLNDDLGEPPARRSGGFTRGFSLVLVLVFILVLIYTSAAKISQKVPMAAPILDGYVAMVDQGRVWLDATISSYTPK